MFTSLETSLSSTKSFYQQYEDKQGSIGNLHEYLYNINLYAKKQCDETDLQKWRSNEDFRRKWLEMLQSITAFIERKYRKFEISDQCFASVTCAVTVQVYGYVADCFHAGKTFDGKKIVQFISAASQCFKRKDKAKDCFELLEKLMRFPDPTQTASIYNELR